MGGLGIGGDKGGEDWDGFGVAELSEGTGGRAGDALFEMIEVPDQEFAHLGLVVVVPGEVGEGAERRRKTGARELVLRLLQVSQQGSGEEGIILAAHGVDGAAGDPVVIGDRAEFAH